MKNIPAAAILAGCRFLSYLPYRQERVYICPAVAFFYEYCINSILFRLFQHVCEVSVAFFRKFRDICVCDQDLPLPFMNDVSGRKDLPQRAFYFAEFFPCFFCQVGASDDQDGLFVKTVECIIDPQAGGGIRIFFDTDEAV